MIKFYLNKCSVKGPFTFCPRALYNTLQTYVLALHKFSHTLHWCLSFIACILVVAFCSCIYCDRALSSLFFPSLGIIVNMYNINGSGSNNKNWLKTQHVTTHFYKGSGELPPLSDDHYDGHDGDHADGGDRDQGAHTVRPAGELHLVVLRWVEVNGREQQDGLQKTTEPDLSRKCILLALY